MANRAVIPRRLQLLQSLDRIAGGWLVRGLPARRDPRPAAPLPADAVARLLVIRPGGLGDAVLTWPMLHELRAAFPRARVEILAERRNAGAYELGETPPVVHRYDRDPLATLRRLRAARYDLVVDTEQYHHLSVVLARALGPRWLCGFDTLGRGRLHTHPVPHDEDRYEVQSFLDLAAAVTGRPQRFDPAAAFLEPSARAREWAERTLGGAGHGAPVTIMPGASSSYRVWPAARYAEVARRLVDRGCRIVLLGGADTVAAAREIAGALPAGQALDLAGRTTVEQSAAILAQSRLALSPDTGVLHLACAVGTPTVSLFGAGRHRKWAPPGPRHRVVRKGLDCSPCTRFGRVPPCPYDVACMSGIAAGEVIEAMESLL